MQESDDIGAMLGELKSLAENGDAEAQAVMAECYFRANGVEKNPAAGTHFFELAEAQNFDFDENFYALAAQNYFEQRAFPQAANYFKKAAELGDTDAFFGLGKCYFDGLGVEKNVDKAFECFQNAYDFGLATSELFCALGECHFEGAGTKKNVKLAIQFFERASRDSFLRADYFLAHIFYVGAGTPQDLPRAAKYFEKLIHIGFGDDAKLRELIAECRARERGKKGEKKREKREEKIVEKGEKTRGNVKSAGTTRALGNGDNLVTDSKISEKVDLNSGDKIVAVPVAENPVPAERAGDKIVAVPVEAENSVPAERAGDKIVAVPVAENPVPEEHAGDKIVAVPAVENPVPAEVQNPVPEKRRRGRPRKNPVPAKP